MEYLLDREGEMRLAAYLERIGAVFRTEPQRRSFAVFATGLMGDGERKSAEPMATRACPDPDLVDRAHQRLAYFTRGAEWSDRDVRREAARYALEAMTGREPVMDWIIDDTGFPKQGRHSVGVQRQYTGTLGKVGNCQVGVSLSMPARSDHVPVDFGNLLPEVPTDRVGVVRHAPVDLGPFERGTCDVRRNRLCARAREGRWRDAGGLLRHLKPATKRAQWDFICSSRHHLVLVG
jgi:SRSO17 transposase